MNIRPIKRPGIHYLKPHIVCICAPDAWLSFLSFFLCQREKKISLLLDSRSFNCSQRISSKKKPLLCVQYTIFKVKSLHRALFSHFLFQRLLFDGKQSKFYSIWSTCLGELYVSIEYMCVLTVKHFQMLFQY